NISTFIGGSVEYYIKPDSSGGCYFVQSVRPNLLLGGTTGIVLNDAPRFAGPSNIWSPAKGFLVQSTSPSSYDRNFPTTGADGLYFDLLIGGIDASQLSWTVNTGGSIRAEVSWTRPRSGSFRAPDGDTFQADRWIRDKSSYVTRVTLHGPRASSSQINSSNPSPLTVPSLPQTFELVGRDRGGNEVRYGFVLRQWFVLRDNAVSLSDQIFWCSRLGYRLARVRDLTNSNYRNLGAVPSSGFNGYKRHIGAGFFSEWGLMAYYTDAGFVHHYGHWTSDAAGSNGFLVYSNFGDFYSYSASIRYAAVCTAP
ncbi:hypothetical protein GA0061081_1291, partial [Gilliamella bombicola]